MKNNLAPIILFVYNRLEHTKQTVEALQNNILSIESDLYIYSDAAKDESSQKEAHDVRKYLKTITGFKNIYINEREENYGLAKSIINGVTDILKKHETIIVMEDDLVTSPYFLQYMNDALKAYENDAKIASIHGYIYPIPQALPETFFIKGADCWAWATWRRAWDIFEEDGQKLLDQLKKRKLIREFNFNNSYPYSKMLEDQIKGKNNSWAIRWYASAFLNDMLTLYPGKSLVNNIGLDNSGVHCSKNESFESKISQEAIDINKIELTEDFQARKKFELYFKSIKPSLFNRVINKIKNEYNKTNN